MKYATGVFAALLVLAGCSGGGVTPDGGGAGGGSGGATRTELAAPSGQQYWNGRWSPDGTKIALHLATKGALTTDLIAVMDKAGANLTPLADAGTYLATAAWNPEGTSVYFTDSDGISKVPAAGGPVTPVAVAFAAFELDLSPDGTEATYNQNGGVTSITLRQFADGGTSTVHTGGAARFSPDGTQIAFVEGASDAEHFWLIKLSDHSLTDLGLAGTYLASVGWFADGKKLAVTSDKGIEVFNLVPNPPTRTVIYADAFASTGIDVSSDSKRILYRVNGSSGLFVLTGF